MLNIDDSAFMDAFKNKCILNRSHIIINGHMMDSLVSLITGTGSIRTIMDNPSSLTLLTEFAAHAPASKAWGQAAG